MSTFLNDVARFVLDNILNNVPVLMGLIAMLGLLLQRKPLPDVVKGALMTAFGMVILQAGSAFSSASLLPSTRPYRRKWA